MEIYEFHHHRVDRMLSFSPIVGIGTPLPPHPRETVFPHPLLWLGGGGGGGTHTLAGEGLGGVQFRRGDRHCCTVL
jgi:hypothetical protein